MPRFQTRDPNYAERVTDCFRNESSSSRWGGELTSVEPGRTAIRLPVGADLASPPGMQHRSYVAALLDDACILAALSLTSDGDGVSMVEYKLNFLATTSGENLVAIADVVRPGRSITVCRADAFLDGRLVTKMLATLAVSRPA